MAIDTQTIAHRYISEIKEFFKLVTKNISHNIDENGEALLDNAGIAGSVVKLFGQHVIDDYFEQVSEDKLQNFGVKTYIKAAMDCAEFSIKKIDIEDEAIKYNKETGRILLKSLENINKTTSSLHLYLVSSHNPAIQQVKRVYIEHLEYLNLEQERITKFSKYFNIEIESYIDKAFGKDYEQHKEDIKIHWLNQNEELLLANMVELKRVGLQENESLGYEQTYGQWCSIESLQSNSLSQVREENQTNVASLLENLFTTEKSNFFSDCITFIVADFGKGKSVFLKQYSSMLAEEYQKTNSGMIPVYFNLNKYHDKRYDPLKNRGILESFLRSEYKIDIEDEYFSKKEFIFLIDSLDESGDLNKIHEVIDSIYKINKNAPLNTPTHKIIIASRPIDKELSSAICNFKAKLDNNKHAQFISLYGFKSEQFDHWLKTSVLSKLPKNKVNGKEDDSVTELLFSGWLKKDFSAYQELLRNNVLDKEELVKPLFAYILYQLLTNNINIPSNGRVGIYLAFLHYISSQAKFLESNNASMKGEYCNRKVLHAISALWCKQRSTGENAVIARDNINFTLLGTKNPDAQAIKHFNTIDELKFLSHSYFGDNEQNLHFQHQSFAEILLAEYFLKVFLNEALNDDPNINRTRELLFVGEPTNATMEFFSELVKLLVLGVVEDGDVVTSEIKSKRKLLLPIVGSLSAPIFREKLHNPTLKSKIFKTKDELHTELDIIEKYWPITKDTVDNLFELANGILLQNNRIHLAPHFDMTPLFSNELVLIENDKNCKREDVDKWLAICLGGLICKNKKNQEYFFNNKERALQFFELIQTSSSKSIPFWVTSISEGFFQHLKIENYNLSGVEIDDVDFKCSTFNNVEIKNCVLKINLEQCNLSRVRIQDSYLMASFEGSSIENSYLNGTTIRGCNFSSLKKIKNISLLATSFWGVELPITIQSKLNIEKSIMSRSYKVVIGENYMEDEGVISTSEIIFDGIDKSLGSFLESSLNLGVIADSDISNSFEFMSDISRDEFIRSLPKSIWHLFCIVRNEPKYIELEKKYIEQKNKTEKSTIRRQRKSQKAKEKKR